MHDSLEYVAQRTVDLFFILAAKGIWIEEFCGYDSGSPILHDACNEIGTGYVTPEQPTMVANATNNRRYLIGVLLLEK